MEDSPSGPAAAKRIDAMLVGIIMLVMFAGVWAGFHKVSPYALHYSTWDFWFESDPPAVADQMTNRLGRNHLRDSHHPLTSLLLFPPTRAAQAVLGSKEQAIGFILAAMAATWVGIFFATLRLLRLRRVDALVFTALAAVSASVIFWFPVPEAYALGALSILLAVAVVALSERGVPVPLWARTTVATGTFGSTSTNWMAGLLMLFWSLPRRKAFAAAFASAGLLVLLWGVQKIIFPTAGSPWKLTTAAETEYLFNPESLGLLRKTAAFLFHAIVMPEIGQAYGYRLSVQPAFPGAGGLLAGAAAGAWTLLLLVALLGPLRRTGSRIPVMLGLLLLGQLAVALAFGVETFLYSAHWGPVLILLCAMSALTRARRFAVPIAAVLVLLAGVNNLRAFAFAADALQESYQHERTFTERVAQLTDATSPIICGRHAAAAQGEPPLPAGQSPLSAPLEEISSVDDPDTCYFHFDGQPLRRQGWIVSYENWSMATIEALRGRGAKYFITPYRYGLEHQPALFKEMDARYRKLEHTPGWVFYELSPAVPLSAAPGTPGPARTLDRSTQRT